MVENKVKLEKVRQYPVFLPAIALLLLLTLVGCKPSIEELEAVDYTPLSDGGWEVSTPEEQGLDPMLVAELFYNASELETLYSVLIVKNSYLIAEDYFNEGSVDHKNQLQSTTKSMTSALVGIAIDQGCLESVDQKLIDFFPEYAAQITDPRKKQITIRDMLQMRSGYPDEESHPDLFEALLSGDYLRLLEGFPLTADPGTSFQYSGLTSHWLGVIVSRACGTDLMSFAQEYLFAPIGAEMGNEWIRDADGYYIGLAGMHLSSRDMAKVGLLYLNEGEYEGKQVISTDYVRDSLRSYSEGFRNSYGDFRDLGYGFQWWSARVGGRYFNYAAGHGGQYIVLLEDADMVVVATAYPFWQQHDDQSWKHEKAVINLLADFIASFPSE